MKKLLMKIIKGIEGFFNRMADQEAERLIRYYSQIFASSPEGGRSEKIKIKCVSNPKVCNGN